MPKPRLFIAVFVTVVTMIGCLESSDSETGEAPPEPETAGQEQSPVEGAEAVDDAGDETAVATEDEEPEPVDACGGSCGETEVCEFGRCLSAQVPAVTAGDRHSCARRVDGTVECWGWDRYGLQDPPGRQFRQIDAGDYTNCGITEDNTIDCWGSDAWHLLEHPEGEFEQVSVGKYHACAIRADGGIDCWGQSSTAGDPPDGRFRDLSAGDDHTCAIREDDTVACWGSNRYGQLEGVPEEAIRTLGAGGYETCGVREEGGVVCWSDPREVQRTRSAEQYAEAQRSGESRGFCGGVIPAALEEPPPERALRKIAVGRGHACGLYEDGTTTCWGARANQWIEDPPSQPLRDISAGARHYCGVTLDDEIVCWGHDGNGRAAVPDGLRADPD